MDRYRSKQPMPDGDGLEMYFANFTEKLYEENGIEITTTPQILSSR